MGDEVTTSTGDEVTTSTGAMVGGAVCVCGDGVAAA